MSKPPVLREVVIRNFKAIREEETGTGWFSGASWLEPLS